MAKNMAIFRAIGEFHQRAVSVGSDVPTGVVATVDRKLNRAGLKRITTVKPEPREQRDGKSQHGTRKNKSTWNNINSAVQSTMVTKALETLATGSVTLGKEELGLDGKALSPIERKLKRKMSLSRKIHSLATEQDDIGDGNADTGSQGWTSPVASSNLPGEVPTRLNSVAGGEDEEDSMADRVSNKDVNRFIDQLKNMAELEPDEEETDKYNLWRIIHPYEEFRVTWDMAVMCAMGHAVISIPFQLCFDYEPALDHPFTVISVLIDLFFLCDVYLNFRTGFMAENRYICDSRSIALRYMKGWLFVDLITSIPFGFILEIMNMGSAGAGLQSSSFSRAPRLLRLLKTFRIIKLLKLFKLMRVMSEWDVDSSRTSWTAPMKFLKFVLLIFLMAHLSGCVWYFCGFNSPFEGDRHLEGWLTRYGEVNPHDISDWIEFEAQVVRSYLISSYWAFTTLTTTGFGDIVPVKTVELMWCIVVMFVGTCTFGYIIGNIASLIAHEDETHILIREKIQSINAYMTFRQMPPDLRDKIKRHYEYVWKRTTIYDEAEILAELPATLRSRVALYVNKSVIRSLEFLRSMSDCEVALIVEKMKPILASPQEVIVEENHFGRDMFFCSSGLLEMVVGMTAQLTTMEVGEGSYFAEYTLTGTLPKHPLLVRAVTFSELLSLNKEDFDFVGYFFPGIYERILKLIDERQEEFLDYIEYISAPKLRTRLSVIPDPEDLEEEENAVAAAEVLRESKLSISHPTGSGMDNLDFDLLAPVRNSSASLTRRLTTLSSSSAPLVAVEEEPVRGPITLKAKLRSMNTLFLARLQLWKLRAKLEIQHKEFRQKRQDMTKDSDKPCKPSSDKPKRGIASGRQVVSYGNLNIDRTSSLQDEYPTTIPHSLTEPQIESFADADRILKLEGDEAVDSPTFKSRRPSSMESNLEKMVLAAESKPAVASQDTLKEILRRQDALEETVMKMNRNIELILEKMAVGQSRYQS